MSNGNAVGVIIFSERASRGVPGSIKNSLCRVWIQREMMRRRIRVRETTRRTRSNKEAGGVGESGGEWMMRKLWGRDGGGTGGGRGGG